MGTWTRPVALAGACAFALSACAGGIGLPQPPDPDDSISSVAPRPPVASSPAPSASAAGAPRRDAPEPHTSPRHLLPQACTAYEEGNAATAVAIEPHRYANVCLGMSFSEAGDAMPGLEVEADEQCPWYAVIVDASPLTIAATTNRNAPGVQIVALRVSYSAKLGDLDPGDTPRTAEGIGLGSTTTDIARAFPGAFAMDAHDSPSDRTDLVVPHPGDLGYVFRLSDDRVTEMTWGTGLADGNTDADFCER